MRCFRWHISIYTNKIKLHRPRHCKNKREQIFSYTYGGLVSRTSRELRAITMAFSPPAFQQPIRSRVWNLADRPEFLRGPILANDDIREHMGEAKHGPDRRLMLPLCRCGCQGQQTHFWGKIFCLILLICVSYN